MLTNPKPDQIATMSGTACAFSFYLVLKPGVPWALVRPPHVVVNRYQLLPKYELVYALPAMDAHIYYVEIDDPEKCMSNAFSSTWMVYTRWEHIGGMRRIHADSAELTSVRLIPHVPEFYALRVNALTPGIYDFDIAVDASLPGVSGSIPIRRQCRYLFDTESNWLAKLSTCED
jgi:hypothetical protein